MLYRPPKQVRRAAKKAKKKILVRLEAEDAFTFLRNLRAGSVDLIISSPPYCMGKEYDKSHNVEDFIAGWSREEDEPWKFKNLTPYKSGKSYGTSIRFPSCRMT